MLISLNWLNDYVDISGISVEDLRKKMSAAGLSVERQHEVGEGIEQITIGEIVEKEAHPDSDHLWVTKVNITQSSKFKDQNLEDNENRLILQIVTGAQNIEVGQKVPVVQSGQSLPDGTEIITTKLRGIESQGMMCSAKELGLGDDHSGILILDAEAPVGVSFAEHYGYPDLVFDVEITPNRGDLLSMMGIAREVSVLVDRPLKTPRLKTLHSPSNGDMSLSVQIEDKHDCDRFAVVGLEGNFSVPTPFYIQQRLARAGMRPISLLVDLSNYVMLEIGQPNHAYAARMVHHGEFYVRRAHYGEQMQLLDGSVVELDPHNLLISDDQKILGLAGIMGGDATKIQDDTTQIILEAAHFDGVVIRKTTMSKNVRSEASMRFERKVDPALPVQALERFYTLLSEITRVDVVGHLVDENHVQYENRTVTLRSQLLKTYLGKDLAMTYVARILSSLGFDTEESTHAGEHGGWHITVSVPSWRMADVSIEEDLIEEVARMYGYDNIHATTPKGNVPEVAADPFILKKERVIRSLVSQGWWELLTYSFNSESQIKMSGNDIEKAVRVHNSLTVEHQFMRMSLLPNLLQLVEKNSHAYDSLRVFESSRVYHQRLYSMLPEELVNEELEREHVGLVVYDRQVENTGYRDIVSAIESMVDVLNVKNVTYAQKLELLEEQPMAAMFHPGRVGTVIIGEELIGLYGQLHPRLQRDLGFEKEVWIAEVDFAALSAHAQMVKAYEPFSVYPKTTESLSFLIDEQVNVGEIVGLIKNTDDRIVDVRVNEPYRGEGVPEGQKAITVVVSSQQDSGPISDKDAAVIRQSVSNAVMDTFGAKLRSA